MNVAPGSLLVSDSSGVLGLAVVGSSRAQGEEGVDYAGGGVGDGGEECGLVLGGVPEDLDVQGGEQFGLDGFG